MNSFIKQAIIAMDTNAMFPNLIDITYYDNSGNASHYYYNDTDYELTLNGNKYIPMLMTVKGGEREEDGIGEGSLSLSDVDRTWTEKIRLTKNRPLCTHYECAAYFDTSGNIKVDMIEQTDYKLKEANYDGTTMEFKMMFDENMDINVPVDEGNSQITSGCC